MNLRVRVIFALIAVLGCRRFARVRARARARRSKVGAPPKHRHTQVGVFLEVSAKLKKWRPLIAILFDVREVPLSSGLQSV